MCIFFHVHGNQWQKYFPKPIARVFASLEQRGIPNIYRDVPVITISDSSAVERKPWKNSDAGIARSPRAVLTYSRTLSGPEEELILLEYDQTDRFSWVLSRNEDRTYALDIRVRRTF